jgi:raffinose/stachyose/melibiose transport system substrate-binding protein
MKTRILSLAAVAFLLASQAVADPVKLRLYSFYTSQKPVFDEIIGKYEAAHPGTTVASEYFENTAYDAALRAAFASGNVPDIIVVEPDARAVGMYPLIKAKQLAPLKSLYEREGWDKKFYASVLKQLNVNGEYYSVPVSVNNFSLFYNNTILKKYGLQPPKTYADLQSMARALKKDGIYPISFGNQFPQRGRDYFYMIAGQLDPSIITDADSGKIPWTDPRLVRALQKMKDLADEGIFMPGINAISIPQNNQAFLTGRAATVLSGPWDVGPFEVSAPKEIELGVARFPALFDGVTGTSPGGVGYNFAIPSSGKNVETAKDVLAFMLKTENLAILAQKLVSIAPYAGPHDNVSDPLAKAFIELQSSNVVPRVLLNAKVLDALGNAIQGVLAGEITPAQAMQEVEAAR